MLNSIGPIWDGNEVWLVIAGGVLFAVFPLVYASLFSGFYLAFMLVLFVMILRTVAMEFRSKEASPRWRSFWDTVFALASTGLAFLLGVAFGDVLSGVPMDADGNMSVTLIGLLTPFPLLVGATTVAMFAMHGSLFLVQKTEGDLQARIRAGGAAADRCVLRPQYGGRGRDGAVPPADHDRLCRRLLARHLPGRGPGGHPAGLPVRAPGTRVRRVPRLERDDRLARHLGRRRDVPEPHHLDHRSRLQPDDPQRRRRPRTPSWCA